MWHTVPQGLKKQKAGVVYRICWQVEICDALSNDTGCKVQDPMLCFCSARLSFCSLKFSLRLLIFYFPATATDMAEASLRSWPLGPLACPQYFGVPVGSSFNCTLFNRIHTNYSWYFHFCLSLLPLQASEVPLRSFAISQVVLSGALSGDLVLSILCQISSSKEPWKQ